MSANHVNVRLNSNVVMIVHIELHWSVKDLKNEIARRNNLETSDNLRIIFAGRELPDDLTMQDTDINQSVVHVVEGRSVMVHAQTLAVNLASSGISSRQRETASTGQRRSQFYVYCQRCKSVCPGKLRVRCSVCKEGSFILQQGPDTWDDVLKLNRIMGICQNSRCVGRSSAEFYFKCSSHVTCEDEHATPLPNIKTNLSDTPCLACEELQEVVFVFPCSDKHTICLACFHDYCIVSMNERQFTCSDRLGYTLPCPGNSSSCNNSFITDFHHFYVLGDLCYNRLKDFAADEFIRQEGGVFCPGVGCGAGYILERGLRRVECRKCRLVFCALCQEPFHNNRCNNNRLVSAAAVQTPSNSCYTVDPRRVTRASQVLIEETTKPCPNQKCRVRIEKNGGCMHMVCTSCRHEFCWMCMTKWSRECQADHWFG